MLSSRPVQLTSDGVSFPTRTPGRSLKNRAENAHAGIGVPMTVNGKGKNTNMAPRTPFQPASAQPQRLFKDQKTVLTTIGRPLIDKTPMPNRIGVVLFKTPAPGNAKPSKLRDDGGQEENDTPGSAQRPSSMRKHIKHPRFSAGKVLQTPANTGAHWEISDEELVLEAQPIQETIPEHEDDFDEVEYGPPNNLHLPYEPYFGFDLPNYTDVGKSLFQLAHSHYRDDVTPPPEMDIPYSELETVKWDMISLPDIASDDPFFLARSEEKVKPIPVPNNPSYLRSKRVPGTAINPSVATRPRPQSSLTTASSSRPATRVGKVASTPATPSMVSTLNATKPVLKPKGKTTSSNAPLIKTNVAPTKSTRPVGGKTSSLSTPPSRTGTSRQVAPTKSTSATAARSAAVSANSNVEKPRPAAGSVVRRPHTASSIRNPATSLQAQKKGAIGGAEPGILLVEHDGGLDDELDFKFEL